MKILFDEIFQLVIAMRMVPQALNVMTKEFVIARPTSLETSVINLKLVSLDSLVLQV